MGRRAHSEGTSPYSADNGTTDGPTGFVPSVQQPAASGDPAEIRVCEYCHRKGRSGDFYSGTKRFCSVGCCHRYSASHQRKRVPKPARTPAARRRTQAATQEVTPVDNGWLYAEQVQFEWQDYLVDCGAIAAPSYCFPPRIFPADISTRFLPGMKLELSGMVEESPRDCHLVTIDKLFGLHLIMMVDGCPADHEAVVRIIDSADMHPLGWAKSAGARVVPHKATTQEVKDDWDNFLARQLEGARSVPASAFVMPAVPPVVRFEVGDKLELEVAAPVVKTEGEGSNGNGTESGVATDGTPGSTSKTDSAAAATSDTSSNDRQSTGPAPAAGSEGSPSDTPGGSDGAGTADAVTLPAKPEAKDTNDGVEAKAEISTGDAADAAPDNGVPSSSNAERSADANSTTAGTAAAPVAGGEPSESSSTVAAAGALPSSQKPEEKAQEATSSYHVATVARINDNGTVAIGFDGFDDREPVIIDMTSPLLHPVRYCEEKQLKLNPPQGVEDIFFDWSSYLSFTKSKAAPRELFTSSNNMFQPGMKIEAMDVYNAPLVCVATISDVRKNEVLIHFDGWSTEFDYWANYSSLNIFPIGWCQEHDYLLQTPPDDDLAELMDGAESKETAINTASSLNSLANDMVSSVSISSASMASFTSNGNNGSSSNSTINSNASGSHQKYTSPRGRKRKSDSSSASSYSKVSRDSDITSPKSRGGSYFSNDKYDGAPRAVFNIACSHGPHLDNNHMDNLPREVCGSTVSAVLQCVLQHLINCGKNSMGIFQEIKNGHSNATVHCNTKNGERFIKHIQHVENQQQLWSVIGGLLQKLQCCENFIQPRGSAGRCPLCVGNIADAPSDEPIATVNHNVMVAPTTAGTYSSSPIIGDSSSMAQFVTSNAALKQPSAFHTVTTPGQISPQTSANALAVAGERSPKLWSAAEVQEYLNSTDCAEQAQELFEQDIDGKALMLLTPDTLVKLMGVRLGPALKICNCITALKTKWGL